MEDLKLIEATEKDIDKISDLATLIWHQHYPAIIGTEQVNYMLNLMYSKQSLTEQLTVKKHRFFLVSENNTIIGFISVNQEEDGKWFLNKFYIDQNKAAKGIGTEAFNKLKDIIHPKKISLTVNRGNIKSINFYFKNGFTIEKTATFDIGNGFVMDDFIMTWKS